MEREHSCRQERERERESLTAQRQRRQRIFCERDFFVAAHSNSSAFFQLFFLVALITLPMREEQTDHSSFFVRVIRI
jgi:hypothetical protein